MSKANLAFTGYSKSTVDFNCPSCGHHIKLDSFAKAAEAIEDTGAVDPSTPVSVLCKNVTESRFKALLKEAYPSAATLGDVAKIQDADLLHIKGFGASSLRIIHSIRERVSRFNSANA